MGYHLVAKTLPSDTYEKILSRLKNKNIKIVVDCTKDTLLKTLSYNPFMIKPNKEELEEVLNCKINDDIELERQVTKLIELGAENVIVSLGKDGAFIKGKNIQALKIKAPKEEGDARFIYLPVKVKFSDRGPAIYLRSGKNQVKLTEETVAMLDDIDILTVDMDIRPYDDEINGKPFRSAYLQPICVTQEIDRFAARFAEEEYPEE